MKARAEKIKEVEESKDSSPLPRDRNPNLERELSQILYSTIACTLVDPDAINFNVEAAVSVILKVTSQP